MVINLYIIVIELNIRNNNDGLDFPLNIIKNHTNIGYDINIHKNIFILIVYLIQICHISLLSIFKI